MKTRFVLLCALAFLAVAGRAQVYVWNSTANGNWNAAANWLPATGYPNAPGDVAVFTNLVSSNGTTSVSIPAGTVVTCGVIRSVYASNSYAFVGGGTLVMTNPAGPAYIECIRTTAGGMAGYMLQFQALGLVLLQDLVLSNGSASGSYSFSLTPTGMVGNANITFAPLSRHCHAGGWNPRFTGTIWLTNSFMYTRSSTVVGDPAICFSNATIIVRNANNGFYNAGNLDIGAALDLGNGTALNPNGAANTARRVIGNVTIDGTVQINNHNPVSSCTNALAQFEGTLAGNGTLSSIAGGTATGNSNVFVGVIAPGGTGVGALRLNRAAANSASSFFLGTAADAVELRIDILSNAGPGVGHDYLEVSNALWAVDLGNIDLVISNQQSGAQTNWFFHSTAGFAGAFKSVTANGANFLVQTPTDIGIVIIPEPALMLAVIAAVALRRR